jgi:aspartokinase
MCDSESLLDTLSQAGLNYHLAVVQKSAPPRVVLQFVMDYDRTGLAMNLMANQFDRNSGFDLQIHGPVELVHFSGPHFGDRYGVAAAAFVAVE